MIASLRKATGFIGNLFFPKVCVFCEKACSGPVCRECLGLTLLSEKNSMCGKGVYDYGKLFCFGKYVGILKKSFADYKFNGKKWKGRLFGKLIYEWFGDVLSGENYSFITFVPISRERYMERGFDQSKEIALEIGQNLNLPVIRVLENASLGSRQSKLGREERFKTSSGKFRLVKGIDEMESKKILLVDDLITTGATANECGKLLSETGATVDLIVFATGRSDI